MEAVMSKVRMAVVLGMTAALAACSENSVAPSSNAASAPTSITGGGASAALTSTDTIRFSITIEPWHQTSYYLGSGNSIVFPAHSLCDVQTSTYGVTEWDKPCVPETSATTVNVKAWLDGQGHARVDFDQHLRFVPSNTPAQWVVISFADFQASLDPFFNILYCPTATSVCFDESVNDPTLLTVRNPITGKITRRIKHFSGYNVAAGDDGSGDGITAANNLGVAGHGLSISADDLKLDDLESVARAHPNLSPNEVATMLNNIRFARQFSGYILASG
jgi:hypothetical protein